MKRKALIKTYQTFKKEIVDTSEPREPIEVVHLVGVSSTSHYQR